MGTIINSSILDSNYEFEYSMHQQTSRWFIVLQL